MLRVDIEVEDVNGSFARLIREAPKKARYFLSTAVFQTAAAVEREMDARVAFGPDGEGRTPNEHIKLDIEHRGRHGGLHAQVGVFDDLDQMFVAIYNEYAPNEQSFMKPSAEAEAGPFLDRAKRALAQCERALTGF
jgi:hypothetical protein